MKSFDDIAKFSLAIYLFIHFCNAKFINDIVSNYDDLISSLWNIKTLFEELQNIHSNLSELHRMQKVVKFTMEKLISKFIYSNATITR